MNGVVYGEAVKRFVSERLQGLAIREPAQGIGYTRNGHVVAGILYEDWNGASVVCHMAASGRFTREFLRIAAEYAFRQLGVHKIIAPVFGDNFRMRNVAGKMGFILEGELRDCAPHGVSILTYTLTAENCPFLGERYIRAIRGRKVWKHTEEGLLAKM